MHRVAKECKGKEGLRIGRIMIATRRIAVDRDRDIG